VNQQIIDALNGLIATELVAVNQYFVHSKLCDHWGFERLASHFREDSMEEMRDVEAYMDRVLLLGGLPNLQRDRARDPRRRAAEGRGAARR
jgi:bacterioferritin